MDDCAFIITCSCAQSDSNEFASVLELLLKSFQLLPASSSETTPAHILSFDEYFARSHEEQQQLQLQRQQVYLRYTNPLSGVFIEVPGGWKICQDSSATTAVAVFICCGENGLVDDLSAQIFVHLLPHDSAIACTNDVTAHVKKLIHTEFADGF